MSSLASSPPKAGGEAPLHNWARMQYPESYMRSVEGESMGQVERDGYSAAEMAQMRRSEIEKARMYAYEGRGPGGQYAAMHMHHMPAPYHAAAAPGAYMRHMAADRDYSGEMDEYAEYPGGIKMNSVSSAVREVATRMNEVRLGHGHSGHMMTAHHMDDADEHEHVRGDYGHRGNGEMMPSMRQRMSMRAADMMAAHEGKMNGGYGNAMLMNLGGGVMKRTGHGGELLAFQDKRHGGELLAFQDSLINVGGHPGVPYIPAQPQCLPFAAMHGSGYGGSAVVSAGMGGSAALDMHCLHGSALGGQAAKHNKYCHFCQHVKVRASGMLACCNKDCTRRFCEHCLSKSIGDDVNPLTSSAWVNGQWHCPVCRKLCCCAIGDCDKNHRHCKAYRYRVRRAEQQAVKRAGNAAHGDPNDSSPSDSPRANPKTDAKADANAAEASAAVKAEAGKAEAAIEIDDKQVSGGRGNGAPSATHAYAYPLPQRKDQGPCTSGASTSGASTFGREVPGAAGAVRAKTEKDSDTVPLAPACSPASSGAASGITSSVPSPQSMSMGNSTGLHRRLLAHRDGNGSVGAPVDVNDIQTMADSWLRLLEEEGDDLEADFLNAVEDGGGVRGLRRPSSSRVLGAAHEASTTYKDDDPAHWRRLGAGRHSLPSTGSSDSLKNIMSIEEGGGMMGNSSSQSLHEMMRDTLLRNVSRDNLMMHDSLSRNVSNVSLTELVRNYSSGSLEAVMEQGEAWPDHSDHGSYASGGSYPSHATYPSNELPHSYSWQAPATVSPKMGGGDMDFLQADAAADSEASGEQQQQQAASIDTLSTRHPSHHNYLYAHQASTGKRMHRTHSHNKLVHETVSTMGRGMPRPPSYEKLSRQCATQHPKQ